MATVNSDAPVQSIRELEVVQRVNALRCTDNFTMFPMLSTTHHYRLQHLAHHQFPNDPERDPDITQMAASGHLFQFPMRAGRFVWECVIKQFLWFPNLLQDVSIRAKYNATGGGTGT